MVRTTTFFFVELEKTSDDKSVPSTTNENIRKLNVNDSPFPKCLLNTGMACYIPCRSTHILEANIFTIHRAQLNRDRDNKKRAAMNANGAVAVATGATVDTGAIDTGATVDTGAIDTGTAVITGAIANGATDTTDTTNQPITKKARI